MADQFRGLDREALVFFAGLEADNSKTYWSDHKTVYDERVRAPFVAMLDQFADLGPFHVFRPHRDVRFSKDKTPYKTNIAAMTESDGGSAYYVGFSSEGLAVGAGYYHMAADQLQRFREAVDADATGEEVARLVAAVEASGATVAASGALKTAPRGYPKDHPRVELLRRKGLTAFAQFAPGKWMYTAAIVDRVRRVWDDAAPLTRWLDTHVGPSTLAPDGW